ncbi:DNA polymerase eta subunit [Schistosoma japonicum]|uniref:DNA polymerase eta n=1 Tax=Schistosoma japonicum TaxID=6182 RepID=A0A4Z2DEM5_SCHJA|nr:DNA polymerase eta subunit [Schistosoma japonicum]
MGMNRIVMLLDMDCFYVQVEQREAPETKGKPCIVSQYSEWKGGGALAISYEARALGIKRGMFGDEIRAQYPDVIIFKVPEKRGKAELTKYRVASSEVIQCISEFTSDIERASIDEAYVDLTAIVDSTLDRDNNLSSLQPNSESYVLVNSDIAEKLNLELTQTNCVSLNGSDWVDLLHSHFAEGKRLAIASELVYRIRQAIFRKTGFICSAGIGPNKSIAKLACSLNKPNKQTIVPHESIPVLLENTHINKIRNLGGKLGSTVIKQLKIETLGQLSSIPLPVLIKEYGEKTGVWLHDLSHGIDHEEVTTRPLAQSVGCSKNFLGRATLTSSEQIKRWLTCLIEELFERLDVDYHQYQRYPTRLILYMRTTNHSGYTSGISRTLPSNLLQFIGYGNRSVMISDDDTNHETNSKSYDVDNESPKHTNNVEKLANAALLTLKDVIFKGEPPEVWDPGITCLGLSAGKFVPNPSNSSVDIRCLLQKKQQEPTTCDGVTQLESVSPISYDKASSLSVVPSCDNVKNDDTDKTSPDRKRKSNCSTTNVNVNNLSFFKRLRVAEISAPFHPITEIGNHSNNTNNSNDTNENRSYLPIGDLNEGVTPILATTDIQLHRSSTVDDSPCIESDSESRHSSTTSDSNFFKSYSIGDWIICDKCSSRISVWQVPEHEDFHLAQRIQHEWIIDKVNANATSSSVTSSTTRVATTASTKTDNSTNSNQISSNSLSNKISTYQKSTKNKSYSQQSQTIKKHNNNNSNRSISGSLDKYFFKIS